MKTVQLEQTSGFDAESNNYILSGSLSQAVTGQDAYGGMSAAAINSPAVASVLATTPALILPGTGLASASSGSESQIGFNANTGMYTLEGAAPGTTVLAKASSALAANSYAVIDSSGNIQYVQYNKALGNGSDAPALMQTKLHMTSAGATPSSQPIGPGGIVFSMSMPDSSLDSSYYSGGYGADVETGFNDDQGNFAHVLGSMTPSQVISYAENDLGGDPEAGALQAGNTPGAVEDFLTKTQQAQSQLPSSEPSGDVAAGYAKIYDSVNACVAITADIGAAIFALAYGGVPAMVAESLSMGGAVDAAACALTGYNNYDSDEKAAIGDMMNSLGKLNTDIEQHYGYGGPAALPNAGTSTLGGQSVAPVASQTGAGAGSINPASAGLILGSGLSGLGSASLTGTTSLAHGLHIAGH